MEKATPAGRAPGNATDETYRSILCTALEGFCLIDSDLRFLDVNDSFCHLVGYGREELLAMRIGDTQSTESREVTVRAFESLGKSGQARFEARQRRKDGSHVDVEVSATLLPDGRGSVAAFFRDLSKQRRAEDALREQNEFLDTILEREPECVKVLGPDGELLRMNQAGLAMLEVGSVEEAAREGLVSFVHPDYRPAFTDLFGRVFRGESGVLEFPIEGKEGTRRWLETHAAPLRGAGGDVTALVGVTRDVTERKRAEEELRESEERFRRTNAELTSLFSLSTKLRKMHSVDELLPVAVTEVRELLSADGGAVILLNPDLESFKVSRGDGPLAPETGYSFPSREGGCGTVLATGQPYVTDDYSADVHRLRKVAHGSEIGPAAFVPLQSEEDLLGVLMLARRGGPGSRPFTSAEIRLLVICGEMYGTALRRTFLYDEARRRLSFTEALRRIDEVIISGTDQRPALNAVLDEVRSQLKVDAVDVLLLDMQLRTLEYSMGQGFRTPSIQLTSQRLNEGHAGKAAMDRRLVIVPDIQTVRTTFVREQLVAREKFVAYIGVPLIGKGQVRGVLEIFQRSRLEPTREWLDALEALAGQAAIAIDNASMFEGLQRSKLELELAYDETIEGWSRALDLRDEETEGHTQRVKEMTLRLARELGFSPSELVHVQRGALLHDMGKMGVPDRILLKPGPLTEEDWVIMRKHPQYAFELLSPIAYLRPALDIPCHHHEKWDGTGYPRGLRGEQIPRAARAFAVVDVWDALRSDRPYRAGWTEERILEHIRSLSGTHFDPEAVNAFLRLFPAHAER